MSLKFKCPKCGKEAATLLSNKIMCQVCDWQSENIADGFKHNLPNALDWAVEMEVSQDGVKWLKKQVIHLFPKTIFDDNDYTPCCLVLDSQALRGYNFFYSSRPIQAEKPKTKRPMTRDEVLDFIFENRDKQMWVTVKSMFKENEKWGFPTQYNFREEQIPNYEYTLDKGDTVNKFEVEE